MSSSSRFRILLVDSDLAKPFKQAREKELLPLLQTFRRAFHPYLIARFGMPEVLSLDRLDATELPAGEEPFLLIMPATTLDSYQSRVKRLQLPDAGVKLLVDADGLTSNSDTELRETLTDYDSEHAEAVRLFAALGTNFLLFRLLATFSYHEDCYSLEHFERHLLDAAASVKSATNEDVQQKWAKAVESLLEARRTFYYRDPILLLINHVPRAASLNDVLQILSTLQQQTPEGEPVTLMLGENDALEDQPETSDRLISARRQLDELAQRHPLSLVYGFSELPHAALRAPADLLDRFRRRKMQLELPTKVLHHCYGTYQHSLSSVLPMYLKHAGFDSVFHVPFEDAELPRAHTATGSWEGHDGTRISAIFSKPIPVNRPSSILPLMESLAETMNYHYYSSAVLGCWGTTTHWWWQDLVTVARVQPLFGSLLSLPAWLEFQADGDADKDYSPGVASYPSQTLQKMVARSIADPVSSISDDHVHAVLQEQGAISATIKFCVGIASSSDEEADPHSLSQHLLANTATRTKPGFFVSNFSSLPLRLTHFETTDDQSSQRFWLDQPITVPAYGYAFVPHASTRLQADLISQHTGAETPSFWKSLLGQAERREPLQIMPEDHQFTNGWLTVTMNPKTGGIREIRNLRSKQRSFLVNHFSQQIAYCFPFEKTIHPDLLELGFGGGQSTTRYSLMVGDELKIQPIGNKAVIAISTGWLLDPSSQEKLCSFRQTTRLEALSRKLAIEIEIEPAVLPTRDPWSNYYAARFAWRDQSASITGALHNARFNVDNGRVESIGPIEVATEFERVAILAQARPYYRHEDFTRLDAILIPSGETWREFRFSLSFDDPLPDASQEQQFGYTRIEPVDHLPVDPQRQSGWFFHLSCPQVRIAQWRFVDVTDEVFTVALTCLETAGEMAQGAFTSCFPILEAAVIDGAGEHKQTLSVIDQSKFACHFHSREMKVIKVTLKRKIAQALMNPSGNAKKR